MLVNSVIRPVANAVCKIPLRSTSGVAGARSRNISHLERGLLVSFMVTCWLATPAWVLLNLKEYKKPKD